MVNMRLYILYIYISKIYNVAPDARVCAGSGDGRRTDGTPGGGNVGDHRECHWHRLRRKQSVSLSTPRLSRLSFYDYILRITSIQSASRVLVCMYIYVCIYIYPWENAVEAFTGILPSY